MAEAAQCLALDFGASSIRLVGGRLQDGLLDLRELARWPNALHEADGHARWDYPGIYQNIETALTAAEGVFLSIGADSWGVDYVLLDGADRMLGPAVSYRDRRTDGMVEDYTATQIPAARLFEVTGLPCLTFNTLYQLHAQNRTEPALLRQASRLLLTADYTHFWLSGEAAMERSLASTSQMLRLDGCWWPEAVQSVGLDPAVLSPPVQPGTVIGRLRPELARRTGLSRLNVVAPPAHDTQSAILAVPAAGGGDWAYLSSGTWSILGAESAVPFHDARAAAAGLGNEQGFGGTYCVQTTVTGLWLVQEIQRLSGIADAKTLAAEAEKAAPFRSLIDPANPRFFHPADMIGEIRDACREAGETVPQTPGELARCAYDSLALLYRDRLAVLSEITGRRFTCLHVVGGGSKATLLNRLCAATTGLPVLAGPAEATAIGNILAQLIAQNLLSGVAEARLAVRRSFAPESVEPADFPGLDEAVERFSRLRRNRDLT